MSAYPHRLLAAVSLLLSLPLSAASLDAALEESQRLAEETKKAIHQPHLLTAEPVVYSETVGVQFHGSSAS
ncbi:hypothetical protein [Azotobacter beijerinckii]|uniref:hypothetical protein n=1 Tax=Azotobacter beijerinckii TaxID=170623 RepID=UPI0029546EAE|nr:hypothetical protein [Azotobacter beijerinckii]MDV7210620.1 hypothetical protein [Azotobacter beijerinckii]